jgi:hypothetical protein
MGVWGVWEGGEGENEWQKEKLWEDTDGKMIGQRGEMGDMKRQIWEDGMGKLEYGNMQEGKWSIGGWSGKIGGWRGYMGGRR